MRDSLTGTRHRLELCASRLDGLSPVSYTHLDVYKRQALLQGFFVAFHLSPSGHNRGHVSYTEIKEVVSARLCDPLGAGVLRWEGTVK